MRLSAKHAAGTARVLLPAYVQYAPCIGLAARAAPVLLNNVHKLGAVLADQADLRQAIGSSPWAAACLLSRELYVEPRPGAPVRLTRSRSAAVSHVTPSAAGTILGLAMRRSPPEAVASCLLKHCGIESNRVRGEWTGVSLARYRKLIDLLADGRNGLAVPLFLRFVWERAQSKRCLLDFLVALDGHISCLRPEWRERVAAGDASAIDEWCSVTLSPADTSGDAIEWAARRVLEQPSPSCSAPPVSSHSLLPSALAALDSDAHASSYARAVEMLCADLSDVHAFKPPTALERHAYRGGEPKPDCVEGLAREVFDLLLYDPETRRYDVERLPASASPEVRRHYERLNAGLIDASEAGGEWFPLCQEHEGCLYLSAAPGGRPYELHPSLSNLGALLGALLGHPGWRSLSEAVRHWNRHVERHEERSGGEAGTAATGTPPRRLHVDESGSGPYRPQLSDTSRMRETARLHIDGGRFALDFLLEVDPPIAIATHRRLDAPWRASTREQHLHAWRAQLLGTDAAREVATYCGRAEGSRSEGSRSEGSRAEGDTPTMGDVGWARSRVLHALWPVVLGERMLDTMCALPSAPSPHAGHQPRAVDVQSALLQAVLASRWASDETHALWSPALEPDTADQAHATTQQAARRRARLRAARSVGAVAKLASPAVAHGMLPWMLTRLPADMPSAELADSLLLAANSDPAWLCEVARHYPHHSAPFVASLIGVAAGVPLSPHVLSGVDGVAEAVQLAWFALTYRVGARRASAA